MHERTIMVRHVVILATLAGSASLAAADAGGAGPGAAVVTPAPRRASLALAVNSPFGWADGRSVGGSAYLGFARNHAIRANVARYDYTSGVGILIGDLFFGGDGDDAIREGRFLDASLGYMYFPRAMWSGFFVEGAVLVRATDTVADNSFASPEYVEVHSTTIAGRGLAGWSWLVHDHIFLSVAVGLSVGRELGEETISRSSYDFMPETERISRAATRGEGFLRIGGALDL